MAHHGLGNLSAICWSLTPPSPPATLAAGGAYGFSGVAMGQVHVLVILTNYREEVLAQLGQCSVDQVHRYETEALIDTGTYHSVLPPAVAERLGLLRLGRTVAQMANGQTEEVDTSEVFTDEGSPQQAAGYQNPKPATLKTAPSGCLDDAASYTSFRCLAA